MIHMDTKQQVIHSKFVQQESERSIQRTTGLSRTTIRRYIRKYLKALEQDKAAKTKSNSLSEYLLNKPTYKQCTRIRYVLTDEVTALIDGYLTENANRRESGLRKQQFKAVDIHQALSDKNLPISYRSVCQYVKDKSQLKQEAFIRQEHPLGFGCEFDWGEVRLYIKGELKKFFMAVFTMCNSNYRYAYLFHREDTLAFMESHILFFSHLGYVPGQMVYDNMKVAVARFVTTKIKEPTVALMQLENYYGFTHRFCNVRKGNEKGHVEKSVEFIRRRVFARKIDFNDIAHCNTYLLTEVEKLNAKPIPTKDCSVKDLMQEEYPYMHRVAYPMECSQLQTLKVDKWSTIYLNTNHYSVPEELVGERVDVKIYANKLQINFKQQLTCEHHRCYEQGRWILSIEHYLNTMRKKPGALNHSVALTQANEFLIHLYENHFRDIAPRNYIELLIYCKENKINNENLENTCIYLLSRGLKTLSSESIIATLGNKIIREVVNIPLDTKEQRIALYAQMQLTEITNMFN
jgi:transposase